MFKIRLIKNLKTNSLHISKGTVMVARMKPGSLLDFTRPYQVIEGPHSGLEIPLDSAVPISAEKLYTEAEYKKLLNKQIKSADEHIELKARFNALKEAFKTVTKEKELLQEEINQLVTGKKVALPYDAANELEKFHLEYGRRHWKWKVLDMMWKNDERVGHLRRKVGFEEILSALVNGYTIQETPQERIKRGVREIYEKWTTIPTTGDDKEDGEDLADLISAFVTEELKL